MASSRDSLRSKFSQGKDLDENAFHDLIDSLAHPADVVNSVDSEPSETDTPLSASAGFGLAERIAALETLAASNKTRHDDHDDTHPNNTQMAAADTAIAEAALEARNAITTNLSDNYYKKTEVDAKDTIIDNKVTAETTARETDVARISIAAGNCLKTTAFNVARGQLESAIGGKANTNHTHDYLEASDLSPYAKLTDVAAKANAVHTHSANQITGLDDLFTTPSEVQALIVQNRVLLDETTILDDFYDKAEIDEQFRVKRWRTDQISLFAPAVLSIMGGSLDEVRAEVAASLGQVRVSMNANHSTLLSEVSDVRVSMNANKAALQTEFTVVRASMNANRTGVLAELANTRAELETADQSTLNSAKAYTDTKVSDLIDGAPGALDTLNELAAAIGDDASYASTVTNLIAAKQTQIDANATGLTDAATDRALIRTQFATADAAATTDRALIRTQFAAADTASATDRALIRTQFAAADTAVESAAEAYADAAKAALQTQITSNDTDIANLQTSVNTTIPNQIAAINTSLGTLQTQVGTDLQNTIASIQSDLDLLENKVNVTIDEKVADLQEQVNACMALITILAGTSGSTVDYASLEAVTGIESGTLSVTTGATLTAPAAGESLQGGFVADSKNDTVLAGNADYASNLFKGTGPDNLNQIIAYNENLKRWEWLWVNPNDNSDVRLIAYQEDTDDSHVPEFWSNVNPTGDFPGMPATLTVGVDQDSTSAVVDYLEALRFFTSGYVQQGLSYATKD